METEQIVCACIAFAISILSGIIMINGIRNQGPVFSNTYLWASKEERKQMNKKPEYHLQSMIFGGITLLFFIITIGVLTRLRFLWIIWTGIVLWLCFYAISDSVKTEKKKKTDQ